MQIGDAVGAQSRPRDLTGDLHDGKRCFDAFCDEDAFGQSA